MARKQKQQKGRAARQRQSQQERAQVRRREAEERRQAEAQSELVFNPETPPGQAAKILLDAFVGDPVVPMVAATIALSGGEERLRAVSEAALGLTENATTLSLAADTALLVDQADEAEAYIIRALRTSADLDLRLRLAIVRGQQGRLAEAIELLDAMLAEHPLFEAAQGVRGELLERLYEEDPEADAVARFRDDSALRRLLTAMWERVEADADLADELEKRLSAWAKSGAGSVEEQGERRLAFMREWALGLVGEDGRFPVQEFAVAPGTPPDQAELAKAFRDARTYGLWEVGRPAARPGTIVTDLLTGIRLYAAIPPELLEDLPRWSVLLGYLVPVGPVWRPGSDLVAMSPYEGRDLAAEVLAAMRQLASGLQVPRKQLNAWLDEMDEELTTVWLPEMADPDSDELMAAIRATTGLVLPSLVGRLRELRGEIPRESEEEDEVPLPVELPEVTGAELVEWLGAWPDEPDPMLDMQTPREAVENDDEHVVEALLRYMEHAADLRGVDRAETDQLRVELGLGD